MIQMKKFAGIAVAVAGILALTGFSIAEVPEYLTVARGKIGGDTGLWLTDGGVLVGSRTE